MCAGFSRAMNGLMLIGHAYMDKGQHRNRGVKTWWVLVGGRGDWGALVFRI